MQIQAVHHIGIRVTEEARAVAFYAQFGFHVVFREPAAAVVILVNDSGVEINLIVNAALSFDGKNPLMDVPEKLPGYTHVALRVASIEDTLQELGRLGIAISEGPTRLGPGLSLFIRDPDANVIELRQNLS
ncbi:MAG: VOC family protein [Deltaproteobacteria bacterium]